MEKKVVIRTMETSFYHKRTDRSDGNPEDSGLKGPGSNSQSRQEKVKNIFPCFRLITLEPMIFLSKSLPYRLIINLLIHYHDDRAGKLRGRTSAFGLKGLRFNPKEGQDIFRTRTFIYLTNVRIQ